MPITKSAKKSLKVSRTKQAVNRTKKTTLEKALRTASAKTVNETVSLVDKAAKTGLMHKNKAARIKSRLAKKLGTPAVSKETASSKSKAVSKKSETKTVAKKTAKK